MTFPFEHINFPSYQLSRRLRPGEREKYLLSQEEKTAREAIVKNETDRNLGDLLRSAPHTKIPLTLLELEERDQIESEWGSPFDVVQAVPEHKKGPSVSTEFPYDLHKGKPSSEKVNLNQILSDERFERALLKKDRSNEFEKFDKEYDQTPSRIFTPNKGQNTDDFEFAPFPNYSLSSRLRRQNQATFVEDKTNLQNFSDQYKQEQIRKKRQDLDAEESSAREAIEDEWDSLPFNTIGKFKELMNMNGDQDHNLNVLKDLEHISFKAPKSSRSLADELTQVSNGLDRIPVVPGSRWAYNRANRELSTQYPRDSSVYEPRMSRSGDITMQNNPHTFSGLFHELTHALHRRKDFGEFTKMAATKTGPIWTNVEEKRTIDRENQLLKEMGLVARASHKGFKIPISGLKKPGLRAKKTKTTMRDRLQLRRLFGEKKTNLYHPIMDL